jgi:hypothetical protein
MLNTYLVSLLLEVCLEGSPFRFGTVFLVICCKLVAISLMEIDGGF